MVDATTRHEALSFMDESSGYNQIRMTLSDEEMTALKTPKGIYYYKHVDDLLVKSKRRQDHLKDLKVVFDRLQKYQLRMNPLKCAFGVTSEKFLGFIIRHQWIEIDQFKIDAIQKMSRPKSLYDLRNTFDSIKKYLLNPQVLRAPISSKPLILYIAALKENVPCTFRHIFFAIDKLRHYMQAFTVHLVAKVDPIKYVLFRPIIFGRLAKWAILLQQYEIVYIPQKAMKGQALANFLADRPIPLDWKLCEDLPEDEVFFTKVMEP
ncbi:uncharacterized protein E6C27_scaffold333G00320 [Cucumis melo var. makuwa]|uniref:Reverse transcriptase domain-containing protein n=1 Tax=Cucumis melo var. makuwa TaxID=1194695 RepID=A0A5A7TFL0_CUCMM|nr:uncharacterized protein E6C27_scaffold333G00320 [Cucumis melo var. makuwa]